MKSQIVLLALLFSQMGFAQTKPLPVIDMHLHAYPAIPHGVEASWAIEEEAKIFKSPNNADAHFEAVQQQMEKYNIVLAVSSSSSLPALEKWKAEAPGKFLTGVQTGPDGLPIVSPDSLRILYESGDIDVLGELGLQYSGLKPDHPGMAPYYEVAEELQIPVCLHTGLGPPGGPYTFAPKFRTTLGKPSLFEPVLVAHPNLKVFIAHAGWPYISETIAMMYIYPNLYTDIGVMAWALSKDSFYDALQQLVEAGFGDRILYGSDQMLWPDAIGMSVEAVIEAPFLSEVQKRDILYNNAARFLELSEEEIEEHHGE